MTQHARLWRYAVVPMLLNLFITLLVLAGLIYGAYAASGAINRAIPAAWYYWIVKAVLIAVAFVLAIILSIGAFFLLQVVLCCYFYDRLARQVENALGMARADIREVSVLHQACAASRDLASMLGVSSLALLLNVVPVAGAAASLGVTLYHGWLTCGLEYLGYAMDLRGMRRQEKIALAKANRPQTLGLGATVFVFNFIPVLGSVVLTTAVVGAVLLHRNLRPAPARPDAPAP